MRKLDNFIIIISLLGILTASAFASNIDTNKDCAVTLINGTDKTYVFWLTWVDHPFLHRTWGKPWHKAVAEIDKRKLFTIKGQSPGRYTIKCREAFNYVLPAIAEDFTITAKNKTIVAVLMQNKNKPPSLIIFKYDK